MNYNGFKENVCEICVENGDNVHDDGLCEMSENDIDNCTWAFHFNPKA